MNISSIKITITSENFNTWFDKGFLSNETILSIINVDILIVPTIDFRQGSGPTFERGTDQLLNTIREKLPTNFSADLCVDDDNYYELSLNSKVKRVGKFLVKEVALPLFLAIISEVILNNFLEDKHTRNDTTPIEENAKKVDSIPKYMEPHTISLSITVVREGKNSTKVDIEGTSKDVLDALSSVKDLIENEKDNDKLNKPDRKKH